MKVAPLHIHPCFFPEITLVNFREDCIELLVDNAQIHNSYLLGTIVVAIIGVKAVNENCHSIIVADKFNQFDQGKVSIKNKQLISKFQYSTSIVFFQKVLYVLYFLKLDLIFRRYYFGMTLTSYTMKFLKTIFAGVLVGEFFDKLVLVRAEQIKQHPVPILGLSHTCRVHDSCMVVVDRFS
ncbi:hypothetical protein O6H91_08G034300 [Diphasiastrum complanatum]|uniref:Uncharacterized protein n=1 Tax=Diphasiastrum complanatum TaxID=34168 RepID=A0ACC2CWA2_DIPCM|nr:hypothetical protein O6H91_08G034300 [Diphasiastrum complanatum]